MLAILTAIAVIGVAWVIVKKLCSGKIVEITALGPWAVVTGATDGIGKCFALELAKKGKNIVLISRNTNKLNSTATEIREKYNVETKIIQADFTSPNEEMCARIRNDLSKLEIGVLVNNVGTASPHPEYFLNLEQNHVSDYQNIINCNIFSVVNMIRCVLPEMAKRKKGLIINISSGLSFIPAPLHTIYGATKSFVTKFSRDLDLEYRNQGVHIHVLNTGLVATKLSGVKTSSLFVPMPDTYAKNALKEVERSTCCSGYWAHSLQYCVVDLVSTVAPGFISKIMFEKTSSTREKSIKSCTECNGSKK